MGITGVMSVIVVIIFGIVQHPNQKFVLARIVRVHIGTRNELDNDFEFVPCHGICLLISILF